MDLKQLYFGSMLCKILTKDIANGTISHTYMLILPDKMLAEAYAKFFAMQLYCDSHNICGTCASCRKIEHDNMSDIFYYPTSAKLSVAESRQIVSESFVKPYEMDKKLFVISNFDEATPQSQNALLKVLEEPTPSNIFLLVATSESTILRTILSRAKKISEPALRDDMVLQYLESTYSDIDKARLQEVAEIAGGNITSAVGLLTDKKYNDLIADIHRVIGSLKSSKDVLKASAVFAKYKDDMQKLIDCVFKTYLDINISIASGKVLPSVADIDGVMQTYTPATIACISDMLVQCKNRAKFNCSSVAVIDYMLFGILEAIYKCKQR